MSWVIARSTRSEERRVGSDWSSDVCSSDLVVHDHHGVLLIEDLGDPGVDQMVEDLGGEDVVGHRQVHLGNDKLSGRHLVPPRRAGQDLLGKGHTHLGHQSFKRLWRCTFIASTSASGYAAA